MPRAARANRSTLTARKSRKAGTINATTVIQLSRRKATFAGASVKRSANSATKIAQMAIPKISNACEVPQASSARTRTSQAKERTSIGVRSQASSSTSVPWRSFSSTVGMRSGRVVLLESGVPRQGGVPGFQVGKRGAVLQALAPCAKCKVSVPQ